MTNILAEAQALASEIIADRRYLHQHAELGNDLPLTCAYVLERLEKLGYTPTEICPCGIVATVGNPQGKTILLRADMDALPMNEENNLPFKTTTAYAHTCGHDIHTAMLLGAAKILKAHESELAGTVKLMFQPNEEGLGGAEVMVRAGVLSNPTVDAAVAMHVSSPSPVGTVHYRANALYASADGFTITIHGKGGHGASPHQCIDPINIAAQLYLTLQTLISRETNPALMGVLTIGSIHAGTACNIIPDTLTMNGTIRTYDSGLREQLKSRLVATTTATAAMFGGEAEVTFINGTPCMYADETLTHEVTTYLQAMLPSNQVAQFGAPFSGSEDFAVISEKVPATMLLLGCATTEIHPHHHPKVQFNEDAFANGAAAYAQCAIEWLKNH